MTRSLFLVPLTAAALVFAGSNVTGKQDAARTSEPPAQGARPAMAAARITAAANVTLRSLPSPTSTAVAQIPLGTELNDSGPAGLDRTWLRVKLADGREGWLKGDLTRT